MTGRLISIVSLSLALLAPLVAVGDDGVMVKLYNDDADDIVVTIYDMNAQLSGPVLANQRINGFAWIPVSVVPGAVGKGHVKWIARTTDASFRRCGSQEMHGVANNAVVHVFANSSCGKITR